MLYERTGGETTLFRVLASVLLGLAGHALLRKVLRARGALGSSWPQRLEAHRALWGAQ